VLAEMAEAAFVIFIASDTPGLRWEIETAIERGHLGKCVVVLPHPDLGMPRKAERWAAVCACFEGTPWHAPMAALDIGVIRAVHFRAARELVVIATRTAFARDYEVAMHVAVYGMFCR